MSSLNNTGRNPVQEKPRQQSKQRVQTSLGGLDRSVYIAGAAAETHVNSLYYSQTRGVQPTNKTTRERLRNLRLSA